MGARTRPPYPPAFRAEAVQLVQTNGRSLTQVAKDLGVPAVELHTGRYANTWQRSDEALAQLRHAARHAADMGLFVHAGHGLTYRNVRPVAAIPEIEELNIGHSVVSRAVMTGIAGAVQEMARLVKGGRP